VRRPGGSFQSQRDCSRQDTPLLAEVPGQGPADSCPGSAGTSVLLSVERRSRHPGLHRLAEACAVLLLPAVCGCARSEAAGIERPRIAEGARASFEDRFLVRPDGTALDRRTGLSWQRCPLGTVLEDERCIPVPGDPQTLTWTQALAATRAVDEGPGFAGHRDWRLPSQNELLSIVEARWREPRVVERVFPVTPPEPFLASSVYSAVETLSWEAHSRRGADPAMRVRLVR